ncbi:MAG: hypothetical protein LUK37_13555 [Clostridia bacterium]|nr:hypothetical protein [Clostridia bacterium]
MKNWTILIVGLGLVVLLWRRLAVSERKREATVVSVGMSIFALCVYFIHTIM